MFVEIEEKELAAIEYLYLWMLKQGPLSSVVAACDCVGPWTIRTRCLTGTSRTDPGLMEGFIEEVLDWTYVKE